MICVILHRMTFRLHEISGATILAGHAGDHRSARSALRLLVVVFCVRELLPKLGLTSITYQRGFLRILILYLQFVHKNLLALLADPLPMI
jgi:hypothetical protein